MVAQENYEFDSSIPFDSGPAGRPMVSRPALASLCLHKERHWHAELVMTFQDQAEGADDKTATRRKGVLGKLQGRSAAQKGMSPVNPHLH